MWGHHGATGSSVGGARVDRPLRRSHLVLMEVTRVLERRAREEHRLPDLPVDRVLQVERRATGAHLCGEPRPRARVLVPVKVDGAVEGIDCGAAARGRVSST